MRGVSANVGGLVCSTAIRRLQLTRKSELLVKVDRSVDSNGSAGLQVLRNCLKVLEESLEESKNSPSIPFNDKRAESWLLVCGQVVVCIIGHACSDLVDLIETVDLTCAVTSGYSPIDFFRLL